MGQVKELHKLCKKGWVVLVVVPNHHYTIENEKVAVHVFLDNRTYQNTVTGELKRYRTLSKLIEVLNNEHEESI